MQYAPNVVRKVWTRANELGYGHRFLNEETPSTIDDNLFVSELLECHQQISQTIGGY